MTGFRAAHFVWLKLWTYPAVRVTPIVPPIILNKEASVAPFLLAVLIPTITTQRPLFMEPWVQDVRLASGKKLLPGGAGLLSYLEVS